MADPKLTIRIGAELTEIRRALSQVSKDIQNVRKEANKPAGFDGFRDGARQAVTAVKALAASVAGIAGFASFIRIADQAATLNARLKLATKSQEEFNTAYEGTFDIAQRTRSSLEATVTLYARLERSTRDLAVTQSELLELTETINQAAQLSGGGASAEAALFQLSQGLASGTLRGEELNSVLEQAPRLAEALAAGLDIPIGKLREFATQGKVTSEAIVRALKDQREAIDAEFKQLPKTISGSFTQLQNSITRFIGEADRANGASATIAGAIETLANNIDRVAGVIIAAVKIWAAYYVLLRAGPALYRALTAAADAYAAALARIAAAQTAAQTAAARLALALRVLAGIAFAAFTGWQIGTLLREQFLEVELFGIAMVRGLLVAWERLKQGTAITWEGIKSLAIGTLNAIKEVVADLIEAAAAVPQLFGGDEAAESMRELAAALRPTTSAADGFAAAVDGINRSTEENIRLIDQQIDEMVDYAIAARDAAKAGKQAKGTEEPKKRGPLITADEEELVRDSVNRALRELDRLYADAELSARQYFATKKNLEVAALDSAIRTAQAELAAAKTPEQQSKLLTDIIKLQREREDVALASARAQADAEEDLAEQLAQVQRRIQEQQGQESQARLAELQAEFKDLRDRLVAENDVTGVQLVDKLIDLEYARSRLSELETIINERIGGLRTFETAISAQVDAGLITQTEGERQLRAVREESIKQLELYRQTLQELYDETADIEVLQSIQELDTELARLYAAQQQRILELKQAGVDALAGGFRELITGAKNVEDALRGVAVSFGQALADIAAQALAQKAIEALTSLFGGGGAKSNPATNVAAAAAAGTAYATPITAASTALTLAGGTVTTGAAALSTAAAALQAAATTLLIANSVSAGVAHSGGIIGKTSLPKRAVPAWLFAGAPRYHSGGIVGLKPGEVPAILQTGEEVLSRDDPRNAQNQNGSPTSADSAVRIVNVLDPSLVSEAIGSATGEKAIMNVITRNSRGIAQLLR